MRPALYAGRVLGGREPEPGDAAPHPLREADRNARTRQTAPQKKGGSFKYSPSTRGSARPPGR